eukprot:30850-Pelagococcus_subviridis.AAC.16
MRTLDDASSRVDRRGRSTRFGGTSGSVRSTPSTRAPCRSGADDPPAPRARLRVPRRSRPRRLRRRRRRRSARLRARVERPPARDDDVATTGESRRRRRLGRRANCRGSTAS